MLPHDECLPCFEHASLDAARAFKCGGVPQGPVLIQASWLQAARPFASKTDGKMGYEDFVYFILSEEDKTNNISLDYWFKCIDLDCDGSLRANEMLVSSLSLKLCRSPMYLLGRAMRMLPAITSHAVLLQGASALHTLHASPPLAGRIWPPMDSILGGTYTGHLSCIRF